MKINLFGLKNRRTGVLLVLQHDFGVDESTGTMSVTDEYILKNPDCMDAEGNTWYEDVANIWLVSQVVAESVLNQNGKNQLNGYKNPKLDSTINLADISVVPVELSFKGEYE